MKLLTLLSLFSVTGWTAANCNHDNCYRQLTASAAFVSPFCATYTAALNTETTGLPSFVSQCSNVPSKISSACSCAITGPVLTTSSTLPPSSSSSTSSPSSTSSSSSTISSSSTSSAGASSCSPITITVSASAQTSVSVSTVSVTVTITSVQSQSSSASSSAAATTSSTSSSAASSSASSSLAASSTTSTSSSSTAWPTPDTSCNNAGVQYGVWYNSQPDDINTYPEFDPTVYKSDTPEFSGSGTTLMIGPYYTDNTNPCYDSYCVSGYIYSTYTQSIGLVALDHRGYLFAPLDGEYTINAEGNDNIVLIWLGTDAYSGWTRGNADLESAYPNPPSSTTVTLSAAQWLPIRVMWANGGGPGTFSISITAPDGTELIGPDLTSSPYLVQYSCDGTSPQYPAWNSET